VLHCSIAMRIDPIHPDHFKKIKMLNMQTESALGIIKSPDPSLGRQIALLSCSTASLCCTCSSCDIECPVNIATGRLRPQIIVRMANLGLWDELLNSPDIWYCLTCRRCLQVCPNSVRPSSLIGYIRHDALENGLNRIQSVFYS
jgi:heterodisulfide reductase subunit C